MGPYNAGNSNFQVGASSGATQANRDLWSPYQPLNIPNPSQVVQNEKSFPERMIGMIGDGIGQIGDAFKGDTIPKALQPSLNWLFPTAALL